VTACRLRLAAAADAEAICRIYNQGIEDRVATLETELRTPDERRQWLANRSPPHPVDRRRRRLRRRHRLVELGRQHGFHKLVLAAFPFNAGGLALYEKLGFRTVGIYREQGQLDGKWVDTIIMERLL
jgi:phosphinothricin acetyltransferase